MWSHVGSCDVCSKHSWKLEDDEGRFVLDEMASEYHRQSSPNGSELTLALLCPCQVRGCKNAAL